MHDGGCAGQNSTATGATDPTMVSPGHPHHFGWLSCEQQPLAAERGRWWGYLHDVVVHQENFVDPLHPEIHTQNVEIQWIRAKRKLRRQFGTTTHLFDTTRQLFDTYLREFVWQERHKEHQHRLAALLV